MTEDAKPSVRSRHLIYKAGTQKIVEWLLRTASALENITHILPERHTQLSSKGAKTGGPLRAEYTLKTQDLIKLARTIASRKGAAPAAIIRLVKRVIAARKACARFYAERQGSDETVNESHLHFVKILEEIRQQLKSIEVADRPKSYGAQRGKSASKVSSLESDMKNLFEMLEVHEPSSAPLGSTPDSAPESTTAKPPLVVLENEKEDAAFALWCHLEDLRDLRRYVQEVWQEYAQGSVSLLAATMITETAISLMRVSDDTLSLHYPDFRSWDESLDFLSLRFLSFVIEDVSTTWLGPAPNVAFSRNLKEGHEIIELLCTGAAGTLTNAISATKESIPDSRAVLVLNSDKFNFGEILHHLMGQFGFTKKGHSVSAEHCSEFVHGICDYYKSGSLPTWLVSAAQTYCDVYEVIGATAACASDHYHARTEELEESLVAFKKCSNLSNTKQNEEYKNGLDYCIELCRESVKGIRITEKDYSSTLKKLSTLKEDSELKRAMSKAAMRGSMAGKPIAHIYGLPTVAGQFLYCSLGVWYRQTAECTNDGGMMVALGNLYAICRRLGLLQTAWHDMDFVLATQDTKTSLVLKSKTDQSIDSLLRQYLVALGVPASKFTKGSVPGCPTRKQYYHNGRKFAPSCELFETMHKRMAKDKKLGLKRGDVVEDILTRLLNKSAQAGSKANSASSHTTPEYSATELLHTFKINFIKQEPQLNFDYLAFWLFCNDIHRAMLKKLNQSDTLHAFELVHSILEETANSTQPISTSSLAVAADILQQAIADKSNVFSQKAFSCSSGRTPKHLRPNVVQYDRSRNKVKEEHGCTYVATASSLNQFDPTATNADYESAKMLGPMARMLQQAIGRS